MSQRTSSSRARPLLLAGLLALGGCLDDCGSGGSYDPTPGPGELGNGEFHYRCVTDDDPACLAGTTVADFPARVAVGGRFELSYTWNDAASNPLPDLRSAAPERLSLKNETFTALADGYSAVLAVVGNNDIGDLIHILASVPTEVAVQVERVDYVEYTLAAGAEVRFQAITRDDDSYVLAGLLEFAFAVDDPAVAEIVGTTEGHVMVRGVAPGSTVLHASLGDLTAELTITVEAGTTTGDPTEGTGTGTDSDSTTGDSTTDGTTSGTTGSTTDDSTTGSTTGTTDGTTGTSSTGGVL